MSGNEQRPGRKTLAIDAAAAAQVAAAEALPPVNPIVAKDFLDLLMTVRQPLKPDRGYQFFSTSQLEARITEVLSAVGEAVPGINRQTLEAILRNDPWNYPRWPQSPRRKGAFETDWTRVLDFPQLAAHWESPVYNRERTIAQQDYGVGVHELHFLRSVYEQIRLPSKD